MTANMKEFGTFTYMCYIAIEDGNNNDDDDNDVDNDDDV